MSVEWPMLVTTDCFPLPLWRLAHLPWSTHPELRLAVRLGLGPLSCSRIRFSLSRAPNRLHRNFRTAVCGKNREMSHHRGSAGLLGPRKCCRMTWVLAPVASDFLQQRVFPLGK